jgi:hypothetical protein
MQEAVTNNLYGINTVDLLIIVQATGSEQLTIIYILDNTKCHQGETF